MIGIGYDIEENKKNIQPPKFKIIETFYNFSAMPYLLSAQNLT